MKKCINCGFDNQNEDIFCKNCGTKLDNYKNTDKNFIEVFKSSNKIIKILIIIIAVYLVLMVATYGAHIFLGVPLEPFSEEEDAHHLSEYNMLDADGDGALSFSEIAEFTPDIPYDELSDIFDRADKNDNGLIIGHEFDAFLHYIDDYYKDLENQKKAEQEKLEQEKNTSSSKSSSTVPSVRNDGKCPSCGSDESYLYEYYDEFDRPYYQCTVCDYMTYDEGEFYDD